MSTCDGCIHADWERTKIGRLHPSGQGHCQRLKAHPLDLRLPAAFFWRPGEKRPPAPIGGFIRRGHKHESKCVFKQCPAPTIGARA